ncbi:MAG: glycosyl hydrolase 53 family protein [Paludibacter sp.]
MNIHKLLLTVIFLLPFVAFTNAQPAFAKGGDLNWLPKMKATGYKFYNDSGVQEDCFKILKDHGFNSIRLRTFVNPSADKTNGHCSKDETVAMAVRAQTWGMRIMIDFHYSDTWADPGHQAKPAAWVGHDFPTLLNDLYNYTFDVMTALKTAGVSPEWVQVGNETSGGMVYPEGSNASSWTQLIQLMNKGYDAIKAVSSTSKVILHIDGGHDNARFRWWFDNAKANGAKYDVIGLSYYPYWISGSPDYSLSINALGNNLLDMVTRYGKQVMVVEVGGVDTQAQNTYDMLLAVQNKVNAVPNNNGLGVLYWEPEGARSWSGYALSAWGSDGKPTLALNAFNLQTAVEKTQNPDLSIKWNKVSNSFEFNEEASNIKMIDLNAKTIFQSTNCSKISGEGLNKGIYLVTASQKSTNTVYNLKTIKF